MIRENASAVAPMIYLSDTGLSPIANPVTILVLRSKLKRACELYGIGLYDWNLTLVTAENYVYY
jgi:hypothetical protein